MGQVAKRNWSKSQSIHNLKSALKITAHATNLWARSVYPVCVLLANTDLEWQTFAVKILGGPFPVAGILARWKALEFPAIKRQGQILINPQAHRIWNKKTAFRSMQHCSRGWSQSNAGNVLHQIKQTYATLGLLPPQSRNFLKNKNKNKNMCWDMKL